MAVYCWVCCMNERCSMLLMSVGNGRHFEDSHIDMTLRHLPVYSGCVRWQTVLAKWQTVQRLTCLTENKTKAWSTQWVARLTVWNSLPDDLTLNILEGLENICRNSGCHSGQRSCFRVSPATILLGSNLGQVVYSHCLPSLLSSK